MERDGIEGDLADEKWTSETYRLDHWDQVLKFLEEWTRQYNKSDLFELGQLMGFPLGPGTDPERYSLLSPSHGSGIFSWDV